MQYNKNPISLREGHALIDGVEVMDGVKMTINFTPETWTGRQLNEITPSTRWVGANITGSMTRRRTNNWLKTKIKEYQATKATPEFVIQGIMDDANSDYYAAHGSDVVTCVGCVLTGDLPLTALDAESGSVVDDVINFNIKDIIYPPDILVGSIQAKPLLGGGAPIFILEETAMSKNLKYFMREAAEVEKVVTVPAPESFKDENGKVIQLEVKVLSSERIRAINEGYHTHTVALDKKGNPYINGGNVVFRDERDNAKATRHILVEALQYPKLDDPELMKYYNCVDITQMPEKVFSRADEFAHVTRVVMALLGIGGQLSEEEQKQADEKEIDDAKN